MIHSKTDFVDRLSNFSAGLSLQGRQLVRFFPFAFIGFLIGLKGISHHAYWIVMAREDGPAEYLTSIVYLVASILSGVMLIRLYRKRRLGSTALIVGLMSLLFFFVAMEEISWGQRIFEVQSPEFFQTYNQQEEITLHNFLSRYSLHLLYISVGLYGAFAWKFFPARLKEQFPKLTQFIIPNRLLQGYFLPAALLYLYYDYVSVFLVKVLGLTVFQWKTGMYGWIISRDQEPIELLLAMRVMCFVAILFNRQTHGQLLE